MIVQQTPLVIRSSGNSEAALYQALRDLLDGFMDLAAPPASLSQFPRIWEQYHLDFRTFDRIVNEIDAQGDIVNTWDRGLHIDWIFWVVDRPRADLEAEIGTVVDGALSRGQVTAGPNGSPADMLTHFSTTDPTTWGHGNAAKFYLDHPTLTPSHRFWGEVDAAA